MPPNEAIAAIGSSSSSRIASATPYTPPDDTPTIAPFKPQPVSNPVASKRPTLDQLSSALNHIQTALANPSSLSKSDIGNASSLLKKIGFYLGSAAQQTPASNTAQTTQIAQLQAQLKTLRAALSALSKSSSAATDAVDTSGSGDSSSTGSTGSGSSTTSTDGSNSGQSTSSTSANADTFDKMLNLGIPGAGMASKALKGIPGIGDAVSKIESGAVNFVKKIPVVGGIFKGVFG